MFKSMQTELKSNTKSVWSQLISFRRGLVYKHFIYTFSLGLMNVHYMPRKNGQIVYIIAKSTLFAVFLRANSVQVVPALECYNDFIQ